MRLVMIASMMASMMLCSQVVSAAPVGQTDADAAARRAAGLPVVPGEKIAARYDFDLDQVDGEALKPDHEPIRSRIGQRHENMINLRRHFIPQMLQMANDV